MTANQQRLRRGPRGAPREPAANGAGGRGWPCLRKDVHCIRSRDRNGLVNTLIDPLSGEAYEFGEEEGFLLRHFDGHTGAAVTMERFRKRFQLDITLVQLNAFIDTLRDWKLLDESQTAQPSGSYRRSSGGSPEAGNALRHEDGFDGHRTPSDNPDNTSEADAASKELDGEYLGASEPGPPYLAADEAQQVGMEPAGDAQAAIWKWFDPDKLFAALARLCRPFRWLAWLVPVVTALGIASLFNNIDAFVADFGRFRAPLNLLQNLLFSMITINLLVQLMSGIIARSLGLSVTGFGIRMVFGLIPRFAIQTAAVEQLDTRSQYWFYAGPLLMRAFLFGLAVALWTASRGTGTSLPVFCLLLIVTATISFALSLNPLHNGNGYGLVKTMAGIPDLRRRAFATLLGRGRGDRMKNRQALRAFALASLIYLVFVVGIVLIFVARWLELNYQGTGVVVFLALLGFLIYRFRARFRQRAARRQQRAGGRVQAGLQRRPRTGELVPREQQQRLRRPMRQHAQALQEPRRRWPKYVFMALLLVVMALPYPYETGGPVQILPMDRQEISAETAGVVADVAVDGGETLEAGTYIASMSASEQERDVGTTQAAILEQRARLEELLNLPRPEDVSLATKRLDTARTKARFSAQSESRMERLYRSGTISLDAYDTARRTMEVDKAEVVEARANLEKVKGGAHPQEIEAARYELQSLEEQLKYHDRELLETRFVMPFDGTIVTMNLRQTLGQFLNKGEVFAVVESDEQVRVDLKIPESDISEVKVGSVTRIKIWAYPDRIFTGEVVSISPVVEADTFGRVVTVSTVIDNGDRLLKTGMTGFGKIDGGTKPVIVAFSRMLVRFFNIEIWSWIP